MGRPAKDQHIAEKTPNEASSAEIEARAEAISRAWVKFREQLLTGKKRPPGYRRLENLIAEKEQELLSADEDLDACYDGVFNLDDEDEDAEEVCARLPASHKAMIAAGSAKVRTLEAEHTVLQRLLVWRNEHAPPSSIRAASAGRVSPR